MTAYVEYELRCDGLAGPYDCEPAIYALSIEHARADARSAGWLTAAGSRKKDYCERHRPDRTGGES
jgi:hypothetical protein